MGRFRGLVRSSTVWVLRARTWVRRVVRAAERTESNRPIGRDRTGQLAAAHVPLGGACGYRVCCVCVLQADRNIDAIVLTTNLSDIKMRALNEQGSVPMDG